MTSCNETGCGGTIAADGYCDTCGTKPNSAVPAPVAAGPAPAPTSTPTGHTTGSVCNRDGCQGTISPDSYCDTCGLKAAGGPSTTPARPAGSTSKPTSGHATMAPASGLAAPAPIEMSSRLPGAGTATARSRLTTSSSRTGSTRSAIGAGLINVAPTPIGDPAMAVMSDSKIQKVLGAVPEPERFCSSCGRPVGRADENREGRLKGFCGTCRTQFDFVTNEPALVPGELVGGQYEILGPMAHGGMGWIYLAQDKRVSDRWVVLKGLLNSEDPDAALAAVAERRFLAQIEHANIVNIYNFVTHKNAGYIVMEMVGGQSLNSKLKDRRKANGGVADPLPPAEAIAYVLGILGAFGYLHDLGLVYNDLKPANIMALGDQVKLIDVGAVMRIDDPNAAIFGTQGFQAPEVAEMGPSIASDLFTVGRTLAVMMIRFTFHTGEYQYKLPDPSAEPLFAKYESLYRFLLRACADHPDDRFQSAAEMAEQLTGVLRQVVSLQTGKDHPRPSQHFGGDNLTTLLVQSADAYDVDVPDWRVLPNPKVDPADAAASFLLDLPELDPVKSLELLEAGAASAMGPTRELRLRIARETSETGTNPDAILRELEALDPWDWRPTWQRGVFYLRQGTGELAASSFNRVWTELPGEMAPQLAVAMSAEVAGDYNRAAQVYTRVMTTDSTFVSAAFGLARCRAKLNQPADAVAALNSVPTTSAAHYDAQVAAARALISGGSAATPSLGDLSQASAVIERLQLDAAERAELSADVYQQVLEGIESGQIQPDANKGVLGSKLTLREIKKGLEQTYRTRARFATNATERAMYVDRANKARPRTLF